MSTAALSVRNLRERDCTDPAQADGTVPFAVNPSFRRIISSRSLRPSVASGMRPSPRTWKKRDSDPKNVEHIGRTNDTNHCQPTASGIRRATFAVRQKHENMLTSPCHRVRNPGKFMAQRPSVRRVRETHHVKDAGQDATVRFTHPTRCYRVRNPRKFVA
jgi:hypothetical protein